MKNLLLIFALSYFVEIHAMPVPNSRQIVWIPTRYAYPPNVILRGPFDFIGTWIQNAGFLPIEINVPDTFAAVGGAVGNAVQNVGMFTQGVSTNVNNFLQNAGQGLQTFSHNVASGFQNFTQFLPIRPNRPSAVIEESQSGNIPQKEDVQQQSQPVAVEAQGKYFILIPMGSVGGDNKKDAKGQISAKKDITFDSDVLFETYP